VRSGTVLEVLARLNRGHAAAHPGDTRLDARIRAYELAARMQLAAPEALDLSKEPDHVLKLYGLDHGRSSFDKEINALEETDIFGRKCLVARRLLERGVRYVQIWSGNDNGFPRRNWDSHEDVERDHGPLALGMARGAAALIQDLKQRGSAGGHAGDLEHRVRADAEHAGREGAGSQPLLLHHLAGGRRHPGRDDVRPERRVGIQAGRSARIRPRSTTSTRPCCTCWGSTTPGSPTGSNGVDRRLTDVHGHVLEGVLA
jgi:hypothetical protein